MRGMTLVETAISIGIISFIIGFVAFLTFISSINAYNIHDQVIAQTNASTATEKFANTMRQATHFSMYAEDYGSATTPTRVLIHLPPTGSSKAAQTTAALCWDPGNLEASPPQYPQLLYFADADSLKSFDSKGRPVGTPTQKFSNIRRFEVMFESEFRVQLTVGYEYRGFAFVFKRPEVPQIGHFTTDIIARNHFLHFGPNGYTDFYDHFESQSPIHL